jgi:hypothetical protein
MAIHSCKGCVAPKRYPGCHSVCPEYIEQKAEHDRIKAEHDQKNAVSVGIYGDRAKKVYNALKGYRGNKYRER